MTDIGNNEPCVTQCVLYSITSSSESLTCDAITVLKNYVFGVNASYVSICFTYILCEAVNLFCLPWVNIDL